MSRKSELLKRLTLYFMEKGKIMDKREYLSQTDAPVRVNQVATLVCSWSMLPKMIKHNFPAEFELIGKPSKEEIVKPTPKKKEVLSAKKK